MTQILAYCITVALLFAAIVCAAAPGGLLSFLSRWYLWWQIHKPMWLPNNPTGGCVACTTFWLIGVPCALYGGIYGGWGWQAVLVPPMVAVLSDKLRIK
jgi:hypothetical protein